MKKIASFILTITLLLCFGITVNAQVASDKTAIEKAIIDNGYRKIILKRMLSGHLSMPATVNGVKGHFILDTGAGATVLDAKVKDKFNAKAQPSAVTGVGAGASNLSIQSSTGNKLETEGYSSNNYTLYFTTLDHVNDALKQMGQQEIDGVLGADFLTLTKAIIDYSTLTLYVHP